MGWYICIAVGSSTAPIIDLFACEERLPLLLQCLREEGEVFARDCPLEERNQCAAVTLLTKELP